MEKAAYSVVGTILTLVWGGIRNGHSERDVEGSEIARSVFDISVNVPELALCPIVKQKATKNERLIASMIEWEND